MTDIAEFRRFILNSRLENDRSCRMSQRLHLLALDDRTLLELRRVILEDPLAVTAEIQARVTGASQFQVRSCVRVMLGVARPHRRSGTGRLGQPAMDVAQAAAFVWQIPARLRRQLEQEAPEVRRRAMEQWRMQMAAAE